jgi:catalase
LPVPGRGRVSLLPAARRGPHDKVRGKPEKFSEHYNQATLFWNSQSEPEKQHIINAFRFELSKVTVPAIRKRMVSSLRNVADELATAVAEGLGLELPEAMPRAIKSPLKPEIKVSKALSLLALPGTGGIATRKIAIMIANSVKADSITSLIDGLTAAGAVPRLLGIRLGTVRSEEGVTLEADASLENSPSVIFDAVVLPDGAEGVDSLALHGPVLDFIKDQYRHGKTILAIGASSKLLDKAGVAPLLRSGHIDPGILTSPPGTPVKGADAFLAAIARHRHPSRDADLGVA